jgi:hypothetical protein
VSGPHERRDRFERREAATGATGCAGRGRRALDGHEKIVERSHLAPGPHPACLPKIDAGSRQGDARGLEELRRVGTPRRDHVAGTLEGSPARGELAQVDAAA